MNSVNLVGNLCRDPELRHTGSGFAVCDVGVAVERSHKDKDGNWTKKSVFVDVTVWGRQAEFVCERGRKGTLVSVEGELDSSEWEDKQTGAKRSKIKVNAVRLRMLSKSDSQRTTEPPSDFGDGLDDEIPF